MFRPILISMLLLSFAACNQGGGDQNSKGQDGEEKEGEERGPASCTTDAALVGNWKKVSEDSSESAEDASDEQLQFHNDCVFLSTACPTAAVKFAPLDLSEIGFEGGIPAGTSFYNFTFPATEEVACRSAEFYEKECVVVISGEDKDFLRISCGLEFGGEDEDEDEIEVYKKI